MSEVAKKRLQALQEMSYLGAGFRLAMKDLEIRGAGNIFGPEQSGHVHEIGFDLYIEMLEKAVAELRGEELREEIQPVIDLNISAFIPETYVEDVMIRMGLYRRISSFKADRDIDDFSSEMRDRFGLMPREMNNLLSVMRLKLLAKELAVLKIHNVRDRVSVVFSPETPVRPEQIFNLHQTRNGRMKFLPDGFEIDLKGYDGEKMIAEVYNATIELRQGMPVS